VRVSFDIPEYTGDVTGLGTTRILDAIRRTGTKCRFYQASSSEMFGAANPPQNEATAFVPRSPYAAAKLYAYWITRIYREGFGIYGVNGILFNHESPRRGETFVTRKITRGLALIQAKKQDKLYMGNLDAKRDWGYAPDYVRGMWLAMQQDQGDDYVLGTGEAHSVREFLEEAFGYLNLDYRQHVEVDPYYLRPLEVDHLLADFSKAKTKLGWTPHVTFRDLVHIMVDADLEMMGLPCPGKGKEILRQKFEQWHHWDSAVTRTLSSTEGTAAR
jgi:GDPmannose 4,6-dehydratase